MAYIRIDKDQPNDTRLLDLADAVAGCWQVSLIKGEIKGSVQFADDLSEVENRHALRNALLGALVTLWCYADTHIRSDDTLPVTLSGLAPLVGLPVTVLKAFPACWLIEHSDCTVELPGYCQKNGITGKDLRKSDADEKRAERREKDRLRQQKHREKNRLNGHGVTSRKKSRARHAVTPPTGTGTGTPDPTSTVPQRAATRQVAEGPAAPREETPEVKQARSKLRGVVAGLRTKTAVKPS